MAGGSTLLPWMVEVQVIQSYPTCPMDGRAATIRAFGKRSMYHTRIVLQSIADGSGMRVAFAPRLGWFWRRKTRLETPV